MEFDRKKSLQELEGVVWCAPNWHSYLVTECHRLQAIPLCDFTVGNLEILIGQNFSLDYLVPLAIDRLEEDPLVEGDYYPGDLLISLLRAESGFWRSHPEMCKRMMEIAKRAMALVRNHPGIACEDIISTITGAYRSFQERH